MPLNTSQSCVGRANAVEHCVRVSGVWTVPASILGPYLRSTETHRVGLAAKQFAKGGKPLTDETSSAPSSLVCLSLFTELAHLDFQMKSRGIMEHASRITEERHLLRPTEPVYISHSPISQKYSKRLENEQRDTFPIQTARKMSFLMRVKFRGTHSQGMPRCACDRPSWGIRHVGQACSGGCIKSHCNAMHGSSSELHHVGSSTASYRRSGSLGRRQERP